jgi:L-seryl-tRNA(Ser) seleniumtransferase
MVSTPDVARRALPSVDRLLNSPQAAELLARHGRPLVLEHVRILLDERRKALPGAVPDAFDENAFFAACESCIESATRASIRPVFNLTGTVLHTNLGRAVMPRCAAEAVVEAMTRPVNLEFDLDSGGRGERDTHIERWLTRLTGAEAALVVNNNAAAVYLTLNTLALRKEVIVSRGELIEIGGAFRIPDIMSRAGCKLREVGTTNRTHLRDFEDAITPSTAALMKVHTSNYVVQGFTAAVAEQDLAGLAHTHGLPCVIDLGSGMLVDLREYGLPHEPTPAEAMAQGADIVTFSGDKLLGGPQAGLVVGKKKYIDRIRKNPMKRAMRCDKMTLAALEAVLLLYANPERLLKELPTLRWLTRKQDEIEAQAVRLLPAVARALAGKAQVELIACSSQIGSGSLPVDVLPSAALAITPPGSRRTSGAQRIAEAFRRLPMPVVGRISDGAFLMDLRCLDDEEQFVSQLAGLEVPVALHASRSKDAH